MARGVVPQPMSVSRLTESKARSLPARAPGGRDLPLLFYFSFLIHFASVIYFVNLVCLVCSKEQRSVQSGIDGRPSPVTPLSPVTAAKSV